jgi:DNA polymerase-1
MGMMDTLPIDWEWDWSKIHDLSISSHLLGSAQRKDLTTLAITYLGINIEPYELAVEKATKKAQRLVRSRAFQKDHGIWLISTAPGASKKMPSGTGWKSDMWLLKEMITHAPGYLPPWGDWDPDYDHVEDHPWVSMVEEYANADSSVTIHIFEKQQELILDQDLEKIYEERRKLLRIVYGIEQTGVTVSKPRAKQLISNFLPIANEARERCIRIAENRLSKLPISGNSNALKDEIFNYLGLVSSRMTPKKQPSINKDVLAEWLLTLNPNSKQYKFIEGIQIYRKRMTAINYLYSYERFWRHEEDETYILHPSLNMCGTRTLRWSSSNPNEQNVSKQEGFNLRYAFGPRKGFLWASFDYENIELRIPAYGSGEQEQIALFEEPDKPPFYGSNHLLNFSIIYPDLWEPMLNEYGLTKIAEAIKQKYKSTWYQRCKNGNFAVQYGSTEVEGKVSTADKAYGRVGCHAMLKQRFEKLDKLNQLCIDEAAKTGFVQTMPDKFVDPDRGYPLQCKLTKWGKIKPTIPLNTHVQGTACWVISVAMLLVQEFFDEINKGRPVNKRWAIVMQIHDELVIEFPKEPGAKTKLTEIKRIMTNCGLRIGVPLRVGCEIHTTHWAEGNKL